MPFSVGIQHGSPELDTTHTIVESLTRSAEVLDVVMSCSPGLGLGRPTGMMDVWGSRWPPSSAPGSLDSPAHLEVVCGRWLWTLTCPQSSTPSSECGWPGVFKPWHSLLAAPVPVSLERTHSQWGWGWCEVGSVIVFKIPKPLLQTDEPQTGSYFLALTTKMHGSTETHNCRNPAQLHTGISWSASITFSRWQNQNKKYSPKLQSTVSSISHLNMNNSKMSLNKICLFHLTSVQHNSLSL